MLSEAHERALTRKDLLPFMGSLLWIIALFAGAILLTRLYAAPINEVLSAHARLGILLFFGATALAVLMPLFPDLPLVPFAVLIWGSWWSALFCCLGGSQAPRFRSCWLATHGH